MALSETDERIAHVRTAFAALYSGEPVLWAQAPGRVDLMGSHTDYNEGYVLTMPIDRTTWIAARPRDDRQVTVHSLNIEGGETFSLDGDIQRSTAVPWTDYVRGVAKVLQDEGYALRGFDGLVHSTVPFGSGLSSSAALEVATATLFNELGGLGLDPVRLAVLCQRAENTFVGVNCGILDQYTSAAGRAGHVLLLDCRHLAHTVAPIHPDIRIVICDTRYKRALTGSEYPQRRAQCEAGAAALAPRYPGVRTLRDVTLEQLDAAREALDETVYRRSRFIVQENQRVLDLAAALPEKGATALGALTAESFAGARDLYEIVVPQMEAMLTAIHGAPGVLGARQAGAGFGGCLVAFVERDCVGDFGAHVCAAYREATGIESAVYAVEAAPGAGLLAVE
ncbi:MAG: galactokinase [Anaerolineae bacterium]|nr:galactokinase [Anaerolineae bacterium]